MNASNAKDYLPLVQALADGKVIQHKGGNGWYDCAAPGFDYYPSQYRIKPEPKEIWVNEYSINSVIYGTEEEAEVARSPGGKTVRYREVIE